MGSSGKPREAGGCWASTRTEYATRAVPALSLADGGACSLRRVWTEIRDAPIAILEPTTFAGRAERAGGLRRDRAGRHAARGLGTLLGDSADARQSPEDRVPRDAAPATSRRPNASPSSRRSALARSGRPLRGKTAVAPTA